MEEIRIKHDNNPTTMRLSKGFDVSKTRENTIILMERGEKSTAHRFTPDDEFYPVLEKMASLEECVKQVQWERNIAISQLNDLGYELGEIICDKPKINDCCKNCDLGLKPDDCSRQELLECRFHDVVKKYVAEFNVISALMHILTYMNSDDKLEAMHTILYSLEKGKEE